MVRIAAGCDHVGLVLKESILEALQQDGHAVLDLGTFSTDPVDYPDFARTVSHAVRDGFAEVGLLICESGTGASIAANKVKGVRAAFCHDLEAARQSREEDDANVLCLSARAIDVPTAIEIVGVWLAARFSGADQHVRQVAKINKMEEQLSAHAERVIRATASPRPASVEKESIPPRSAEPAAETRDPSTEVLPSQIPFQELVSTGTAEERRPETEAERPVDLTGDASAAPVPAQPAAAASAPERTPIERLTSIVETLKRLEEGAFVEHLWVRDARLWSANSEEQALIRNRLGWLTLPTFMQEKVGELREFAEVRRLYSHVVFLGVGASSLAAEVFAQTFGSKKGFPDLLVLNCTDPAAVKQVLNRAHLPRTLFIVASKSGTTVEALALYKFFREQIEQISLQPGPHFVAITDGGTPLEKLAKDERFRRVFLNPPTLAGPYSAISYFGLLPAALIGVDLEALMTRTAAMVARSTDTVPVQDNPGVVLGATLAGLTRAGRDKVTLTLSPKLQAFGAWIARLLGDLAGAEDRGLIPVDGEPLGDPSTYGKDRGFVAVTLERETELDAPLRALEAAGHPVLRITLGDPLDLGAEFFRWQVAMATASTLLGVNPFQERNEQETNENMQKLIRIHQQRKRLPEWPVDCEEEGILLLTNQGIRSPSVTDGLATHLAQVKPDDYLALLPYLPSESGVTAQFQQLRTLLRDRLRIATTVQLGSPYLKARRGLCIQIICDDKEDLAVPHEQYSFGVLKNAQALANLQALQGNGRRVLSLRLDKKPAEALERLNRIMAKAIEVALKEHAAK